MNLKKLYYKNFYKQMFYKIISSFVYKKYLNKYNKFNIATINETIDELLATNKSFCRFGDGEFCHMKGSLYNGAGFQNIDDELGQRLRDVFHSNDYNIMIGVTDCFNGLDNNLKKDSKIFWKLFISEMGYYVIDNMSENKFYYNTSSTRMYIDYNNRHMSSIFFNKWKKFFKNKKLLIIEGNGTRMGVNNDLLSDSIDVKRILCPSENAFSSYNKIYESAKKFLKTHKDYISLVALGPTATVLSYDIAKLGYRAIDIGHIDVEYEWYLMNTEKKVDIPSRYVNEVKGGNQITPLKDDKYFNSIFDSI